MALVFYRTDMMKEIRYFSTDGKTMPNGIGFQRGNFLHECKVNSESFKLNCDNNPSEHKGGVIVLSSGADINRDHLSNEVAKEYGTTYFIGNAFYGKYVADNKDTFDERSVTIEATGISHKSLLEMAEMIAKIFQQETILVKDLNKNKIFIGCKNRI